MIKLPKYSYTNICVLVFLHTFSISTIPSLVYPFVRKLFVSCKNILDKKKIKLSADLNWMLIFVVFSGEISLYIRFTKCLFQFID